MAKATMVLLLAATAVLGACLWRQAPPGPFVVFFPEGSVELTTDAREVVEGAAAEIRGTRLSGVYVNGYADVTGPADVNFALSDQRADSVERALIAAGVSPTLVRKIAYGEIQPQQPGIGGRRVEIRLVR
jgi:outer membrane protein OmpA-like peptidoglycan-associated protein